MEDTVTCSNPKCQIVKFHYSCLGIVSIPKLWYCPTCRTLPEFKRIYKGDKTAKKSITPQEALNLDFICLCQQKANKTDRLVQCHNSSCQNGKFFHLACLNLKRMPNNSKTTWLCPTCKKGTARNGQVLTSNCSISTDDIEFVKKVTNKTPATNKCKSLGKLTQFEFDIIASPNGWLDCTIIQEAQILLKIINPNIEGFQRPTLGPVKQFDVMTAEFIQLLHVNGNHWVCMTSIGCPPGDVNLLDSLMKSVIPQEIQELAENLLGPNLNSITSIPVQQQTNLSDCGVFAIAFATCLVFGQHPSQVTFDIPRMRPHLIRCLQAGSMHLFPTT